MQDFLARGRLRFALTAAAVAALALALAPATSSGAEPGARAAQDPEYDLPPPPPELRYLTPVPIVRIAGTATRTGARIRLLRVRSPQGSTVTVRCRGGRRRGCRRRSMTRTSPASRLLRFRPFERRMRAGVRIDVFVRRGDTIGKHTRFTIRKGKAPSRRDNCTLPDAPLKPARCP